MAKDGDSAWSGLWLLLAPLDVLRGEARGDGELSLLLERRRLAMGGEGATWGGREFKIWTEIFFGWPESADFFLDAHKITISKTHQKCRRRQREEEPGGIAATLPTRRSRR